MTCPRVRIRRFSGAPPGARQSITPALTRCSTSFWNFFCTPAFNRVTCWDETGSLNVPNSKAVALYVPYLRRYARALTGSQTSGDAYVVATLEALVAEPSIT